MDIVEDALFNYTGRFGDHSNKSEAAMREDYGFAGDTKRLGIAEYNELPAHMRLSVLLYSAVPAATGDRIRRALPTDARARPNYGMVLDVAYEPTSAILPVKPTASPVTDLRRALARAALIGMNTDGLMDLLCSAETGNLLRPPPPTPESKDEPDA